MSTFEITAPGGSTFTGESAAGTKFRDGRATIDTADPKAASALAYFNGAGYQVKPLGDESVADALASQGDADRTALTEAAALRREIAELKAQRDLEALRKERDDLYREVHGHARDEDEPTPGALSAGSVDEPHTPVKQPEPGDTRAREGVKLAPPQNDAPVGDWRVWAVESGRATEEEVASTPRADIIRTHGKAYDAERAAELEGGAA